MLNRRTLFAEELAKTDHIFDRTIGMTVASCEETPRWVLDLLFDHHAHVDMIVCILGNKNTPRELHDRIISSEACDLRDNRILLVLAGSSMISADMMEYLSTRRAPDVRLTLAGNRYINKKTRNNLFNDPDERVRAMCSETHYLEPPKDHEHEKFAEERMRQHQRSFIGTSSTKEKCDFLR